MSPNSKSASEIVSEISKVLLLSNGKTIEDIANRVLTNQVKYAGDSQFDYWICTDPDANQFGRQVSESIFEFNQDGSPAETVDITQFTREEVESCINSYGYTQGPAQKGLQNITELYAQETNWIIAECLYESGFGD